MDEGAQNAPTLGDGADRGAFPLAHPDGDELPDATLRPQDPQRPVASVGDPDRQLHQPAQQDGQGKLRRQQDPGLEQRHSRAIGGRA